MDYKFTKELDWFSANIPTWTQVLIPEFKDKPINAIELGCFEGRSSTWLLENVLVHPGSTLDCVDLWTDDIRGSVLPIDWKIIKANFDHNIAPFKKKTTVHLEDTATYLKRRLTLADLIYVDAGHFAHEVLVDAVLAHLVLKPGGIIIFDDYLWTSLESNPNTPKPAIDAFIECFARMYQLKGLGYQVILQKNGATI